MVKEISCQFGHEGRLNGILTIPKDEVQFDIALIQISAGFTPKAGPFRLYTLIARRLAALGLVALRFDLGGIGNSEQVNPGLPLEVRTRLDIEDAINLIKEKYGVEKFILAGLCSGAEDSFKYAKHHPCIVGVILIDGHAYHTLGYWFRFMFSRKLANKVGRWIFSKLGLLKLVYHSGNSTVASLEGDQSGLVDYNQLDIDESTTILKTLVARDTKLLYIYTAGMDDKFNSKKQFSEMFPKIDFKDSVSVNYLPRMPHVQVFEEDRNLICTVATQWLEANFSRSAKKLV